MKSLFSLFVTISLSFIFSGCSTYSTQLSTSPEIAQSVFLNDPIPIIYGGVRMDGEILKELYIKDDGSDPAGIAQARLFGSLYIIVDFPISLVADTVLLPWSIYKTTNEEDNKTKEPI